MEGQPSQINFRKKKCKTAVDSFSTFPFDINLLARKSQSPIEAYLCSTHIIVYNIYDIEFLNNNGCFGSASLSRKQPSYHKIPTYSKNHPLYNLTYRCMSKRRFDRLTYLKNQGHTCLSKAVLLEMSINEDDDLNNLFFSNVISKNFENFLNTQNILLNSEINSSKPFISKMQQNDNETISQSNLNQFSFVEENKIIVENLPHKDKLPINFSDQYNETSDFGEFGICELNFDKKFPDQSSTINSILDIPILAPQPSTTGVLKYENDPDNVDMVLVVDINLLAENSDINTNLDSFVSIKPNPFPMVEHLQLSFEEAFFLAYSFGCLKIYDSSKLMNITQLWQAFLSARMNFLPRYVVYHYYRSRGWVVKDGFKYGSDFVLYKKGPMFYHSSFSVVVCPQKQDEDDETGSECDFDEERNDEMSSDDKMSNHDETNETNYDHIKPSVSNEGVTHEMGDTGFMMNEMSNHDSTHEMCDESVTHDIGNYNETYKNKIAENYADANTCSASESTETYFIDKIKDDYFNITEDILLEKHCSKKDDLNSEYDVCSAEKKLKLDSSIRSCLSELDVDNLSYTNKERMQNIPFSEDDENDGLTKEHLMQSIFNQNEVPLENKNITYSENCQKINLNDNITQNLLESNTEKNYELKNNLYSSDYILSQLPNSYPSDWITMSCLTRITEQVAKELLFCFVLFPKDMDVSSPLCLSSFLVYEIIVRRWIPQQVRNQTKR